MISKYLKKEKYCKKIIFQQISEAYKWSTE